jgi:asparagine synthase (glutamine-hydrolysing)
LAALWNHRDPEQARAAAFLLDMPCIHAKHPVLQRDGIAVYTELPSAPYLTAQPLGDEQGTLLGVLFERRRHQRLSGRELREDPGLQEAGIRAIRHLTENYWGTYVALTSNRQTGEWWALRDCSGMIPSYYMTVRGITLVASDVSQFLALARPRDAFGSLPPFEVNWEYIAGFLAYSQLQIRETGLKNVYELLAGETLSNSRGRVGVELAWNPATFANADPGNPLELRCEELRTTAQSCIDAWASVHDWVVHSLSGGFDSSLVLGLLRHAPNRPHVVCVNRYSTGPAEDERRYARIAANAAQTPLIEWPWEFGEHPIDESCTHIPPRAKPTVASLLRPLEASFFAALKTAQRFDAIWSGEGGDHLFLALNTELTVLDSLQIRGVHRGLVDVLRDASRLTGRSIPHLAWDALLSVTRLKRMDIDPPALSNSLLAPSYAHSQDLRAYIQHPWATSAKDVPPGKLQQIILLAEVLHRLRPLPGSLESAELHPLLSQPLIEQCLRIPTYELLCDGRTRGLARRTFASYVPMEIIHREVKGQTTHHVLGMLQRSSSFVTEFLGQGTLAQQGLLNCTELLPLVSGAIPLEGSRLFPVLACVAAEAWARTWLAIEIVR